jgi:predicted enzyme related to lactoylglutathione lyase
MTDLFLPRVGGVLSADIAVPEHEREVRFYSRVLGTGESPLWRDDLMNNLGMPVIGLGERNADYAHLPVQWMPHIQVADVVASVQRALELGGIELMFAKDDQGIGQWAVLQDPNGAAFGIIPVVAADPIPKTDAAPSGGATERVGRIAWLDLTVVDASSTRDFYQQVVGWSVQDVAMGKDDDTYADYNMLAGDGQPAAGVCHARGGNAGLPPVWLVYLPVGDITESLARVEAEGGAILKTTRKKDGTCVYAVVQDPVGAYVALVPG